jgi:hypothetical protein
LASSSHHLNRRTSTGGSAPASPPNGQPPPSARARDLDRAAYSLHPPQRRGAKKKRKTRARGEVSQTEQQHWPAPMWNGRDAWPPAAQCGTGWRTARRRPPSQAAGGRGEGLCFPPGLSFPRRGADGDARGRAREPERGKATG